MSQGHGFNLKLLHFLVRDFKLGSLDNLPYCDMARDYVVLNVFGPKDLVFKSDYKNCTFTISTVVPLW